MLSERNSRANTLAQLWHTMFVSAASMLLAASPAIVGCHSQTIFREPAVRIVQTPESSIGGPDKMEEISGQVQNAGTNQQIVIYARSGVWWIQPFANQPFTKVRPDSTWKTVTHLGTEYAALLVEPGYRPASKLSSIPEPGKGIAAVALVHPMPNSTHTDRTIHFSGYDWNVRNAESDHGGESNAYDPANVWTDDKGYLHLRMAERNGRWTCAEVSLPRSLGYGTYRFVVHDSRPLGPSAVLGFFTWDDTRSEGFHSELDIELSQWGDPRAQNAQYVVQPFYLPANLHRFTAPLDIVTHELHWAPDSATFRSYRGAPTSMGTGVELAIHTFRADVPAPANETLHIDLYDFHHSARSSQRPTEVVIEKIEHLP